MGAEKALKIRNRPQGKPLSQPAPDTGKQGGITGNVYILGLVSFLTDVSSEMILPVLPVFLTVFLGVGTTILGLIEGIADGLSSILDLAVGYWSDSSGNRKKFVLSGYGLSSLSKIGIALSTIWQQALVFRGLDRVGKSIRTAPRDAIIAASSDKSVRGKAFGLHRALDSAGAVIGPAIAYFILAMFGSGEQAYRDVFYVAVVPAFLAVAVIVFFVREPKIKEAEAPKEKRPNFWASLGMLGPNYKRYLAISCLFSLSYFSFALLIVRATGIGASAQDVLLAYTIYNIVYTLASVPMGQLSDKVGRKWVIGGAFLLYAVVCIGFALASQFWQIVLLFVVYGVFVSTDESVNKAYISDMADEKTRGIALGAYNTATGLAYIPASIVFGALWAAFGPGIAFGAAAAVAAIGGIAMLVYSK